MVSAELANAQMGGEMDKPSFLGARKWMAPSTAQRILTTIDTAARSHLGRSGAASFMG
jgi:hypothetical protein